MRSYVAHLYDTAGGGPVTVYLSSIRQARREAERVGAARAEIYRSRRTGPELVAVHVRGPEGHWYPATPAPAEIAARAALAALATALDHLKEARAWSAARHARAAIAAARQNADIAARKARQAVRQGARR